MNATRNGIALLCTLSVLLSAEARASDSIRVGRVFEAPRIERTKRNDRVAIEGLAASGPPGAPLLPCALVRVVLPAGTEVAAIRVTAPEAVRLPGRFRPEPSTDEGLPAEWEDPAVYASAEPYPPLPWRSCGTSRLHQRKIAVLALLPVRWTPSTGEIAWFPRLDIELDLRPETRSAAAPPSRSRLGAAARRDLADLVDNPGDIDRGDASLDSAGGGAADPPPGWIVVTSAQLAGEFEPLRAAREAGGFAAEVVTLEWIRPRYDGLRPDGHEDDATRIRNFILDRYRTRGLRWVLLAGDADGSAQGPEQEAVIIPTRHMTPGIAWGARTPSDAYYGCLDGSFDEDRDGLYGELQDGEGGGDVDFLAEVHVGRAPVDSSAEAANFVRKTLAYESSGGPVLREVLLVGQFLGFGGEYDWGGNLLDAIRTGSERFISTRGFEDSPWAEFLRVRTLYDRDSVGGGWTPSELVERLEGGVHLVNHVGHADAGSVMKLGRSDIDALGNATPFLLYTQSCYAGSFDNEALDGSFGSDSVVEHLLAASGGAAAAIANSRRGWAGSGQADGPSQRFHRRFWDAVFRRGILQWGAALDRSKEESLADIQWSERTRLCAFALHAFGDPALTLRLSSRRGSLAFDRASYAVGDEARLTLIDADPNLSADLPDTTRVRVRAPATGDAEDVVLVETGRSSGVFEGSIALETGTSSIDSRLQTLPPEEIAAEYADADDGTGHPTLVGASAIVTTPLEVVSACPGEAALGVPYESLVVAEGGLPPYRYESEAGYVEEVGPSYFEGLGVRQGWQADEGAWTHALPFEFPFWGEYHETVVVSANGYIDLEPGGGLDFANSAYALLGRKRIALLWSDLVTTGGGDVYVDEKPRSVCFRWLGVGYHSHDTVNCEVELFDDGSIRFGYGAGNQDLAPTIGISAGDGRRILLSSVDGSADLSGGPSVRFYPTRLPGGLALDPATGRIAGMATEVFTGEASLRAIDSVGQEATRRCPFRVRPHGLFLETPLGGDRCVVGSEVAIRWQWIGNIGSNVRIDASLDGSTTSFPLAVASRVPLSARSFLWRLPAAPAPRVRIRVRSVEEPAYFTHGEEFSIVEPGLVLRNPVGGERWVIGAEVRIEWDVLGSTGSQVRIRYSIDGSTTSFPQVLSAAAPNTGSFSFTVPSTPSDRCRVLVESTTSPGLRSVSPADFSVVRPFLRILEPEGGECLETGSRVEIRWSSLGSVGTQVVIEFNTDGSTGNFPYSVSPTPLPNTGSAEWTVPEIPIESLRLRIRPASGFQGQDVSALPLRVAAHCSTRVLLWLPYIAPEEEQVLGIESALAAFGGPLDVATSLSTSPSTLAAELAVRDVFIIAKQKQGGGVDFDSLGHDLAPVILSFLARGGVVVATEQVPESEPLVSALGLVRFERLGEASRVCEVVAPLHPLALGLPPLVPGPIHTAWYELKGERLEAVLGTDEGALVVARRPYGFGALVFLGFDYFLPNEPVRRILANALDVSPPSSGIRFLSPDPGVAWLEGERVVVRWIALGEAQGAVALEYNETGALDSFPGKIAEARPEGPEGSVEWVLPSTSAPGTPLELRVRIRSLDAPQHHDDLWPVRVGAPLEVTTSVLPPGDVALPYRAEVHVRGGIPPHAIAVSGLPDGLIQRTLDEASIEIVGTPRRACASCEVEVTVLDSVGGSASRTLALPIVLRRIELLSPEDGDLWLYGTTRELRWRRDGDVGSTVSLSFNTDGSESEFPYEIAASVPIDGSHSWSLPILDAPQCRLRVRSNEAPEFFASSGLFSIVGPSIRLESPVGGECWVPGREKRILWRSASNPGETLRVVLKNGQDPPILVREGAPDTGSLDWVVPDLPGEEHRIEVSFERAPEIRDESGAPFRIGADCRLAGAIWSPQGNAGVSDAIASLVREAEPESVFVAFSATETAIVEAALAEADVFILALGISSFSVAYESFGTRLRPALEDFVRRGGVVVFSGALVRTTAFLKGLGLASGDLVSRLLPPSEVLRLASFLHPLARDLPLEFASPAGVTSLAGLDGFESVVEVSSGTVAAAMDEGLGRWVYLGSDYTVPDPVFATLLANAVRYLPLRPGLRLLEPRPGSVVLAGDSVRVRWAARGEREGTIRVLYNTDGSALEFPFVAGEAPGDREGGVLDWVPPGSAAVHAVLRLSVRWAEEPGLEAVGSGLLHLVREPLALGAPSLPDGYQNAEYSARVPISGGVPPYTVDSEGLHAGLITLPPEPGGGEAELAGVPIETGTDRQVVLRVRDSVGLEVERGFRLSIYPSSIELVAPAADDLLLAGAPFEVRWRSLGNPGERLRIDYNLDGSLHAFDGVAAESVPSSGSFAWTVPAVESSLARIRIRSVEFPAVSAVSESPFSITGPKIICVHPNGDEVFETGTTRTLRWRSVGNPHGTVRLALEREGAAGSDSILIEDEVPDTGAYAWKVPPTALEVVRLRVRAPSGASLDDASDAPFSVRPRAVLRVLVWVPHAGFADAEVRGAVAAATFHEHDLDWTLSKATDPLELRSELHGKEAFLMVEQRNEPANFKSLGRSLGPMLREFALSGGTLVVLGQFGPAEDFLPAAGLLDLAERDHAFDVPCLVAWEDHPVTNGLPQEFRSGSATAWYEVREGDVDVYAATAEGEPVVLGRDLGDGRLVVVGFDFRDYNEASARLLANALRYIRMEARPRFARGDANASGRVDLGDAITILNWLFQGGSAPPCLDAADVDDSADPTLSRAPIDISDATWLLRWLLLGGPAPRAPSPRGVWIRPEDCGTDPQFRDGLDCAHPPASCP